MPGKRFKPSFAQGGVPEHLNPEQVHALIDAAEAQWRVFFLFLWETGCRVSEALAVTAEGVHEGFVQVPTLKQRGKRVDEVPISTFLYYQLKPLGTKGRLWLYTRQAVFYALRRAAPRAGIDPQMVYPHILRHSYAVYTLEQLTVQGHGEAEAIAILQRLLRHQNVNSTMVYLRRNWDELVQTVKQIKY